MEKVENQKQGLFSECIRSFKTGQSNQMKEEVVTSFAIKQNMFICKGCKVSMERGKMAKMFAKNGLNFEIIPEDLILTELENNLIAKNIIF